MKILITGGIGYIGSCLVERLLNTNHQIAVIDSQKYPVDINFIKRIENLEILSISNTDLLYDMINDCDIVVHLAGMRLPECEKYPDQCYFVNEFMTKAIAEMCKMLDKRMIFSSTCSKCLPIIYFI